MDKPDDTLYYCDECNFQWHIKGQHLGVKTACEQCGSVQEATGLQTRMILEDPEEEKDLQEV